MEGKIVYKVFVGSSLRLSEERNIVKEVLNEEGTDLFEFKTVLYENDGDPNVMKTPLPQEEIDNDINNGCDAFLMITHNWVREKTMHEFRVAKNANNIKHLYILHCDCGHEIDGVEKSSGEKTWDEFYNDLKTKSGDRYEVPYDYDSPNQKSLIKEVRRLAKNMKDSPLKIVDSRDVKYKTVIPHEQQITRIVKNHKDIPRFELESQIIKALNSKKKFIVVTGASTSGKTYITCHAISEKLQDERKVIIMNANSSFREVCMLGETAFSNGKYILFWDDLQDILWHENGEVRNQEFLKTDLPRLISPNSIENLHVIATTYLNYEEIKRMMPLNIQGYLSDDNVEVININPLKRDEWEFYSRQLYCGGYINPNQIKNLYTIGSLFIDLDRLKNQYEHKVGNYYEPIPEKQLLLLQICHSIKCIWIWKKRNRKNLNLLLGFMKCNFPIQWDEKRLEDLIKLIENNLHPLVGVNRLNELEVEDVVVTDVMQFLPHEGRSPLWFLIGRKNTDLSQQSEEVYVTANIVNYILNDEDQRKEKYKSLTKLLDRMPRAFKNQAQSKSACDMVVGINTRSTLNQVEKDENRTDWVDCFLGRCIYRVSTDERAIEILDFALKSNKVIQPLCGALKRYNENKTSAHEDLEKQIKDIFKDHIGSMTVRQHCVNSHNIFFLEELLQFEQADGKEVYKQLDIKIPPVNTKLEDNEKQDIDWFSDADDDTSDNIEFFQKNDRAELLKFYHSRFCQVMFLQCRSWNDIISLVDFMRNNQNDERLFPGDSESKIYFDFIKVKTWRRLTEKFGQFGMQNDLKAMADYLINIPVEPNDKLHFLNKTETLNDVLKHITSFIDANKIWMNMGRNRDGFSLNFMLQKAKSLKEKSFENALLIIGSFLGDKKLRAYNRISYQNINAMLDTASCLKQIRDCEDIFRQYGVLHDDEHLEDFDDEYRMGIILKHLKMNEVHNLLKKQLENRHKKQIFATRNPATLATLIMRARYKDGQSAYQIAYNYVFGKTDCLTKEEQKILQNNPFVLAEMFDKVQSTTDAESARSFFEDERWGKLLANKDALILNRILYNNFIYPYYEDKIIAIKLKKQQGYAVAQNEYTKRYLDYHKKYNSLSKLNQKLRSNSSPLTSDTLELLFLNVCTRQDTIQIWKDYEELLNGKRFPLKICHLHAFVLQLFRIYSMGQNWKLYKNQQERIKAFNDIAKENLKHIRLWRTVIKQSPLFRILPNEVTQQKRMDSFLREKSFEYLKILKNKCRHATCIIKKDDGTDTIWVNNAFLLIWALLYWLFDPEKIDSHKKFLKGRLKEEKVDIDKYINCIKKQKILLPQDIMDVIKSMGTCTDTN